MNRTTGNGFILGLSPSGRELAACSGRIDVGPDSRDAVWRHLKRI